MLLQANMVKRITASGGGDLEAKSGESLRIKRIECIPSSNDTYLTVTVDKVYIAFYRVKGKAGNHLSTILQGYLKRNLMEFLTDYGINVSIPVAEGQTLNVARYAETGNVMLIYDRYLAGDIKATDANGSESRIYTFMQYAKIGTTPAASGDHLIDTSLSPAAFPDFPCNRNVPAGHTIEILGIVGTPIVNYDSSGKYFYDTFLKIIRNREVLFDPDRNGIPFEAYVSTPAAHIYSPAFSLIGACVETLLDTNIINTGLPLMFEPALKFEAGEELNVYHTIVKVSTPTWVDNIDDVAPSVLHD